MFYPTPQGFSKARAARRDFMQRHGRGLNYVRNVAPDGAFNWSVWNGLSYVGAVVPLPFRTKGK